ncbi:hypothetical protein OH77DRAFT_1432668 [Trametes cingulata]|nr:hypothetical protein OH77DRAFT_1432668 [Trametes cingulata]
MTGGSRQVPVEIAESIIDLCAVGDVPDNNTLLTLARASRIFLPRALYNLHRHVVLRNIGQLDRFLQTVRDHPGRGDWVVQLTIAPGRARYLPLRPLGQIVRHVRTLVLDLDLDLYPAKYFPAMVGYDRIHHLELHGTQFAHLWRLLRSFPDLLSLSLVGMRYGDEHSPRAPCRPRTCIFPASLQSLRLENFSGPIAAILEELGLATPPDVEALKPEMHYVSTRALKYTLMCRKRTSPAQWRPITVLIPTSDVVEHFFDPFFEPIHGILANCWASEPLSSHPELASLEDQLCYALDMREGSVGLSEPMPHTSATTPGTNIRLNIDSSSDASPSGEAKAVGRLANDGTFAIRNMPYSNAAEEKAIIRRRVFLLPIHTYEAKAGGIKDGDPRQEKAISGQISPPSGSTAIQRQYNC